MEDEKTKENINSISESIRNQIDEHYNFYLENCIPKEKILSLGTLTSLISTKIVDWLDFYGNGKDKRFKKVYVILNKDDDYCVEYRIVLEKVPK